MNEQGANQTESLPGPGQKKHPGTVSAHPPQSAPGNFLAAPPYLAHFGLTEAPFALTPDPAFSFATRSHQEAVNTLLIAINSGEGFVKIVGEVGTGKSLLCRRLLNALKGRAITAYIPNPRLSATELLIALAEEFQLPLESRDNTHLITKLLNDALLEFAALGRGVVVCVDEAQALSQDALETLRLLSNLETEKRKLMQIVLFGQPELDSKLDAPEIRQLKQRIAFSYRLDILDSDEISPYLARRLKVAGARRSLFSRRAENALYKAGRGIPRLINVLANKALMAAYGEGKAGVQFAHIKAAAQDTDGAWLSFWW
ncbi:MAG: AAA family ATPase [Zoogloeaceae bacterium]|jgi:MSHA biogenesis protein MshM|nr:AAA family ATPase [Zoogloeaceae bacterium]